MNAIPTRLWTALLGIALLSACSSVPKELRQPPPDNPVLVEVRADPDRYIGRVVRWGGTIVSVGNDAVETRLEIIARELYRSGRPEDSDRSNGRFIAEFPGFLDPAIHAEGRDITVSGIIAGVESGQIGEHDYSWPVIRVHHDYLWPERRTVPGDYPARYYYFHDPWYPYYYFPRSRPVIIDPSPPSRRSSPLNR